MTIPTSPAAMKPPKRSTSNSIFIAFAFAAIAFPGCSEDATDETGQSDPDQVTTETTAGGSEVEPGSDELTPVAGPAATAAPSPGNPNGFANLYDLLIAEQEFVQECMQEQGFEYIPKKIDPALAESSLAGDESLQLTDYDYALSQAQDFGYGELYLLLLNTDESRPAPAVDPNDEIRDALSQEEKEARALVLYGTEDGGGCINEAVEFSRGQEISSPDEIERWMEAEAKISEAVNADPRVVQAEQDWLTCMADQGYDVSSLDNVGDSVLREAEEILGIGLSSESSEDELRAALTDETLRSELVKLHDEERKLATTDVECRKDLIELQNSLYQELSEKFKAEG